MLLRMRTWLVSLRDSVVGEGRIQSVFACFIVRNVCRVNALLLPFSHRFFPLLSPQTTPQHILTDPPCAVLTSPYTQKLPVDGLHQADHTGVHGADLTRSSAESEHDTTAPPGDRWGCDLSYLAAERVFRVFYVGEFRGRR
jgi:hypothetical protein